jgi:hypothetical protein
MRVTTHFKTLKPVHIILCTVVGQWGQLETCCWVYVVSGAAHRQALKTCHRWLQFMTRRPNNMRATSSLFFPPAAGSARQWPKAFRDPCSHSIGSECQVTFYWSEICCFPGDWVWCFLGLSVGSNGWAVRKPTFQRPSLSSSSGC